MSAVVDAAAAAPSVPLLVHCTACGQSLPRSSYSRKQWDKAAQRPDCAATCRPCSASRHAYDVKTSKITDGNRLDSGAKVRPNNWGYSTYIDDIFKMRCFPEIVRVGAFSSAKDVSESAAALHAAKRHGDAPWNDGDVVCLCVGDGSAPRTGSLAAFMTKWRCVSVDPALKAAWAGDEPGGIRRLRGFVGTIDEYMATEEPEATRAPARLVVVCVHSHARFVGASRVPVIRARYGDPPTCLVALPCCARVCPERDVGVKPSKVYHDDCVFSAKRRVELWNFPAGGRPCVPCAQ